MATTNTPTSHREELGLIVNLADRQFTIAAVLITIGVPILAYLSGITSLMFYTHVALGAFWFGLDFFFKFVLGPSLDAAPDDAASAVNHQLVPKMITLAEPLSIGVIGSGIGLASVLGYWANPTIWLWGSLGIGVLMLIVGFGPLHIVTTKMAVELNKDSPDGERINALFGKAQQWGLLQTVFMLAIIVMMVGLRGLL
ncbi:hypothetical protein [Halobellus clavatus]|uniref:Uncharacterized protein n=1 Tax=Halobellus clavatus TaxID=660517 RepID=A0A1H3HH35_9EURY|nr:hypothetical protein [Halobellus clavatus]SDY14535.1 hypothetical protein SAMN04487946_10764 [Halobellus clavatus]